MTGFEGEERFRVRERERDEKGGNGKKGEEMKQ